MNEVTINLVKQYIEQNQGTIALKLKATGNHKADSIHTALPGVMRYNKNRLKKYTNESLFSKFANKNSSSPSRSEAVDQKNSSDIFRN